MFQKRHEYHSALRYLMRTVLWCVGNYVPDGKNGCFSHIFKYVSLLILMFQLIMLFIHIWGFSYYYCCHYVADSAVLLRIVYPVIFNANVCLYQIFFHFKYARIQKTLNDLDKIIIRTPIRKGLCRALLVTLFLIVLSLACLLFSYISSCGIRRHYYITYGTAPKPCDQIYIIPKPPLMEKIFFTKTYTKLILETISMSCSLIGITFAEFWMSNIFRILATAFEESHELLVFLLQEEEWIKAKRKKLNVAVLKKLPKESNIETRFLIWKKHHSKLRLLVKRVDFVLSPMALMHTLITPILLCLAGFQLLQKNQEPFMNFLEVKIVSYYLIAHSLFRLWTVCDAGEDLATKV